MKSSRLKSFLKKETKLKIPKTLKSLKMFASNNNKAIIKESITITG